MSSCKGLTLLVDLSGPLGSFLHAPGKGLPWVPEKQLPELLALGAQREWVRCHLAGLGSGCSLSLGPCPESYRVGWWGTVPRTATPRSMLPDVVDNFQQQHQFGPGLETIFYSSYVFFTKLSGAGTMGISNLSLE